MTESALLFWGGLILFAVLVLNMGRRVVKARNISGTVVMGDVYGDINQQQAPEPPPQPKPPLWRDVLTFTNVVLGIVASALVIGSLVLK